MALVIAYDDVKSKQRITKSKFNETDVSVVQTPFLGSRGNPNLPLSALAAFGPGRYSSPHYHDVDQFQIMIEGKGKMGRRDISTNSVHFSRAYTPYGPFIADAQAGLTCLIIRSHPDTGAQHSPEALAELKQIPNRHPWQITCDATFPKLDSSMAASSVILRPVPGIEDDHGLSTYTLNMKPDTKILTPDPSHSNGLFLVMLKGSLLHEQREYKGLTLVYVHPQETKFEIRAGSGGLEGFILSFPRPDLPPVFGAKDVQADSRSKTWQCSLCAFVYDEAAGLPEEGIAPGTRWEDVPATWSCPDCSAGKSDFEMAEV